MPGWLGPWEIVIIVVIIVVIFGGTLLPRIGRSFGRKLVGLKKGLKEGEEGFKSAIKEDASDGADEPETRKTDQS
jgi:sec-independent protein translocase protein TatA